MIRLQITGNIGKDAEMKEFNGKHYISLSVCHTERGKNGQDYSTWVNVLVGTKDAQPNLLKYLAKGTKVYVEGKPSAKGWVDNDGKARGDLNLNAFNIEPQTWDGNNPNCTWGDAGGAGSATPPVESGDDLPF